MLRDLLDSIIDDIGWVVIDENGYIYSSPNVQWNDSENMDDNDHFCVCRQEEPFDIEFEFDDKQTYVVDNDDWVVVCDVNGKECRLKFFSLTPISPKSMGGINELIVNKGE